MMEIQGRQYPTVLSDLFIEYSSGKDLDTDPLLQIKCLSDWLAEFYSLPTDVSSIDVIDELLKKGIAINSYLPSVVARVHSTIGLHRVQFANWSAQTKTKYTGEKLSDAARERLLQTEEQYAIYQKDFAILESIQKWLSDMSFALRDCLGYLTQRIKVLVGERPPMPR